MKNRKKTRTPKTPTLENNHLDLSIVKPKTDNQADAFDSFNNHHQHLLLHGVAGTGKSYIGIYLLLKEMERNPDLYKQLIIIRNVVPTRDMGFLPGNSKEKAREYEAPYVSLFSDMYERGDAYSLMKTKQLVDFQTTSFIRGITLKDCVVFIDEVQNMSAHELNSLITRVGENVRIVMAGDVRQSDLDKRREYSGLKDFMSIISRMKSFDLIEFGVEDIVRSALVKEYIIARTSLEDSNDIAALG